MEVFEAIKARKSVRAFLDKDIAKEVLDKILEATRLAPSAANKQPWHFIVVRDAAKRKALSDAPYAKFLSESPVVIVGCADTERSEKWCVIDITIALQQMVLAATAEGIGTCWIGSFSEDKVKALFKIPDRFRVIAMIAMGYPREKMDLGSKLMGSRRRRDLDEIVSYEEFSGK